MVNDQIRVVVAGHVEDRMSTFIRYALRRARQWYHACGAPSSCRSDNADSGVRSDECPMSHHRLERGGVREQGLWRRVTSEIGHWNLVLLFPQIFLRTGRLNFE